MIGRSSKMQTVSLDQEIKLWDGIPYDINFFQDFSALSLEGVQLSSISVSAIIEAIPLLSDEVLEYPVTAYPSGERHRTSTELWESVEKYEKDERKREKKWEKQHPRPKNIKEAERNFDCVVDKLMRR